MKRLPDHVAIVMDGCLQWGQRGGHDARESLLAGARATYETITAAQDLGLRYLTLLPGKERIAPALAWELLAEALHTYGDGLRRRGLRLLPVGELTTAPDEVRRMLAALHAESAGSSGMQVSLALGYSGRGDVVRVARQLAAAVAAGRLAPEAITPEAIQRLLTTVNLPEPDLIIRTGGRRRLVDALTFEGAYAELFFSAALWPDFSAAELQRALLDYAQRERRFGKISEQVQGGLAAAAWSPSLASSL
ncbi:MAG TPA: polyprenyl diphosphate synthase [Pseudomonadota bacterium]|nr:polyprenyl diphosphate synthase [Pseudomonadota bacterium]